MAAEGQSDRMVSDMEAHMKQRSETEFLHAEKKWHLFHSMQPKQDKMLDIHAISLCGQG